MSVPKASLHIVRIGLTERHTSGVVFQAGSLGFAGDLGCQIFGICMCWINGFCFLFSALPNLRSDFNLIFKFTLDYLQAVGLLV